MVVKTEPSERPVEKKTAPPKPVRKPEPPRVVFDGPTRVRSLPCRVAGVLSGAVPGQVEVRVGTAVRTIRPADLREFLIALGERRHRIVFTEAGADVRYVTERAE